MRGELLGKSRRILEASRAELLNRFYTRDGIEIEKPAEALEEAQLCAERDLRIITLDSGTRCLRDINAALRRIEDGSYGICVHCDELIPERRLVAVPWSARCLSCQQELEWENTPALMAGPCGRCA